jgi:D-alanine-D-alanine ligase
MDKHRTKLLWRACSIPTPDYRVVTAEQGLREARAALGFPLVVKPIHEGSSIGISLVGDDEELLSGWFEASRHDDQVMVERLVDGPEYTIALLDGEALPVVRVQAARQFYDYEAKYADGAGTRYAVPSGLAPERETRFQALCVEACEAVGISGWGRVDLLCDAAGEPWLIDVNTAPGMTGHSLVPMAAKAAGVSFDALVLRILETSLR